MKKTLFSVLVVFAMVATSCGNAQTSNAGTPIEQQAKGDYANVSVTDLNNAISKGTEITLIDVRTPGELKDGYIENALNFNVNGPNFKEQAEGLDKSKTTYVYCRSGHRSQAASRTLKEMGFTDVRNVEGGFIAWSQKGFKSVK